ncbi:MAG TPA: peptide chain release factor N(5)-glutamine methyltransferase [Gammaproteobacteria bacterium]|jgi:release factor glutamine methyltransferase|nr:peptide chain release factor N(5)-glutamine methyltransferase [Gammaproteobacteria bacterium]
MTIQQLLQFATTALQDKTASPDLDAAILLAHVLDQPRSYLYTWPEQPINDTQLHRFQALLQQRCQQQIPIAYLVRQKAFWSLDLEVTEATLIPRSETELLVATALTLLPATAPMQVADLGTGSGAIALALASERPDWHLYATDVSKNALAIASKNAQQLALSNLSFHQGDWCTALPVKGLQMIISNPPYLSAAEWAAAPGLHAEPQQAFIADEGGLSALRIISQTASTYLIAGGYLLMEHGFAQGAAVRTLFMQAGYGQVHTLPDLAGHERVTLGIWCPAKSDSLPV